MTDTTHPTESVAPVRKRRSCSSIGLPFIAATAVAFVVFPPLGLVMLGYAIFRDRIHAMPVWQKFAGPSAPGRGRDGGRAFASFARHGMRHRPDNAALAEYLEREQDRLRSEQEKLDELVKAYEAFKEAEKRAADQRDFDAFLSQRDAAASSDKPSGSGDGQATREDDLR